MTEAQPPHEDPRRFWKTTGLLGLLIAILGILGTLITYFIQHGDDGPTTATTTTNSGAVEGFEPPDLDPPPPGVSRFARVDIQPNDGKLGLGEKVLYRGYLIGYKEGWVVVHARVGSWTGNYTVGKVSPNAGGYWEIPRDTFGRTGAGSTMTVRLIVPLDKSASEWLFQNYQHRSNSDWARDDDTFNRLKNLVVDEIQATRTR
jgi:hypothetical protein